METQRRSVWDYLPRGLPLSSGEWQARHRVVVLLLWAHVPFLVAFGLYMGETLGHTLFEASFPLAAALAATLPLPLPKALERFRPSIRATIAGLGLVATSAILTHLSGGYIEMHFHFFVMVAVMALYQDWPPFLMAIVFVAVHHGVAGVLDPGSVYNHPDAIAHPWKWAGIHAFFILGASAAAVAAWYHSEQARRGALEANEALRQSVSLMEATLEAASDGILVVDTQGRITSFNRRYAAMWGLDETVLVRGREQQGLAVVLAGIRDPGPLVEAAKALIDDPAQEGSGAIQLDDGRTFEWISRPQRLDDAVVGRVWSFRDVTAQRRALQERIVSEQRLMEMQRLEEVNRFKTALLNNASHELNTPLTPLTLQLKVLQDPRMGDLTAPQRRSLEVLKRNMDRLSKLVRNVLDVARLESGEMDVRMEAMDLVTTVEETVETYAPVAAAQGVAIRIEAPPEGAPMQGDPDRISQVLVNLVSNALKCTPTGGTVTVRIAAQETGWHLSVADTGVGLAEEDLAVLFQPFTHIEGTDQRGADGTGLGLYISRGIVQAHGGVIGVESAGAGRGATFWCIWPHGPTRTC